MCACVCVHVCACVYVCVYVRMYGCVCVAVVKWLENWPGSRKVPGSMPGVNWEVNANCPCLT